MKTCQLDEGREGGFSDTTGEAANWPKVPGGQGWALAADGRCPHKHLFTKCLSTRTPRPLLGDTSHTASVIPCSVPGLGVTGHNGGVPPGDGHLATQRETG